MKQLLVSERLDPCKSWRTGLTTLASGFSTQRLDRDAAFKFGLMAAAIRVTGKTTKRMDGVGWFTQMVMCTWVTGLKIKLMELGFTYILMAHATKANG